MRSIDFRANIPVDISKWISPSGYRSYGYPRATLIADIRACIVFEILRVSKRISVARLGISSDQYIILNLTQRLSSLNLSEIYQMSDWIFEHPYSSRLLGYGLSFWNNQAITVQFDSVYAASCFHVKSSHYYWCIRLHLYLCNTYTPKWYLMPRKFSFKIFFCRKILFFFAQAFLSCQKKSSFKKKSCRKKKKCFHHIKNIFLRIRYSIISVGIKSCHRLQSHLHARRWKTLIISYSYCLFSIFPHCMMEGNFIRGESATSFLISRRRLPLKEYLWFSGYLSLWKALSPALDAPRTPFPQSSRGGSDWNPGIKSF